MTASRKFEHFKLNDYKPVQTLQLCYITHYGACY